MALIVLDRLLMPTWASGSMTIAYRDPEEVVGSFGDRVAGPGTLARTIDVVTRVDEQAHHGIAGPAIEFEACVPGSSHRMVAARSL